MFSLSALPYKVDYAVSGRAKCSECRTEIAKGILRIARMVQSKHTDGKQENWYHEECFFKTHTPKSVDEIAGFNKLQNDDQQRLTREVDEYSRAAMVVSSNDESIKKSTKRSSTNPLDDFFVEYSKNDRASCKLCDIKICKGEVRICKTLYDTEIARKYGSETFWHHVKCFAETRRELKFCCGGDVLPGFGDLSEADQQMVRDNVRPIDIDEVPIKKIKSDPEERKLQKILKKQNDLYQKYKTELGKWSPKQIEYMLEVNGQIVPRNKRQALELFADCLTFGALQRCPKCNGQLLLDNFGYKCSGFISSYTSCPHLTRDPPRVPVRVPPVYADEPSFQGYQPTVVVRMFRAAPNEEATVKKEVRNPPLKNLQFFIYGRELSKDKKEEIKRRVLRLGGLVVSKLTDTAAAVVSTARELGRMTDKMADIQRMEIEVVEESFLDLIDPDNGSVKDSLMLICANNIASWGSDPITRVPRDVIEGIPIEKSGSNYAKPSKSKKIIKAGAVVESPWLCEQSHVYVCPGGRAHSARLARTDLVAGRNSRYTLQLLESDDDDRYYVYTAWGRIGEEGKDKQDDFYNLEDALAKFKSIFREKTKNEWDDRRAFVKYPGKYYLHEEDYSDVAQAWDVDYKSDLPVAVQRLVQRIFDVDTMRQAMLEFELDIERLPLGKISREQIAKGYAVLSELLRYVQKGKVSKTKIIDATNRFYNMIPHKFGDRQPPPLESTKAIHSKIQVLDDLQEIEIAYTLRNAGAAEAGNAIEEGYRKLKCELTPLARTSGEFRVIQQYVSTTHAPTHRDYTLEIEEVFKVVREGEDKRYKPFKKLHNRRLLWHGSRVTNFAGILSQGLRIAPPDAPSSGFMFGKGVYFADVVTKSANYCGANKDRSVGFLLLCEVALGNMKECSKAEYVTGLPTDTHSVFGVGRSGPDPARWVSLPDTVSPSDQSVSLPDTVSPPDQSVSLPDQTVSLPDYKVGLLDQTINFPDHTGRLPDHTLVPLGPIVKTERVSDLLYNEYIVYDVRQVNVKYLLQMKFNFY